MWSSLGGSSSQLQCISVISLPFLIPKLPQFQRSKEIHSILSTALLEKNLHSCKQEQAEPGPRAGRLLAPGLWAPSPSPPAITRAPRAPHRLLTTSQEVNPAFPQQAVTRCSCTQIGCLNSWSLRGGQSGNQRKIIPLVFHHVCSFLFPHLMQFTSQSAF